MENKFLRLNVRWNDLLKGAFFASFNTVIINPWLVIFKSVSSVKLSVLTPSSLAALQILPVSHLFFLLFNHVEQQPLLSCISPPLPPSHLSFCLLTLLFSLLTAHEGDWYCPFTCQRTSVLCKLVATAGWVGVLIETENKASFSG